MLTVVLAAIGCTQKTHWQAPEAGLRGYNDAHLFYTAPQNTPGIVLFHAGDLNSAAHHTANLESHTYDYTGTLTTGAKAAISYSLCSDEPRVFTISDEAYDLSEGRVFLLNEVGEISQLPFAPMEPSQEYLARLREYLDANTGRRTASKLLPRQ